MNSAGVAPTFLDAGFPIRRSMDQCLLTAPHGFSQFCHVLHRLLVPRHPPNALTSLTTKTVRPVPDSTPSSVLEGLSLSPDRTGRRSSHSLHVYKFAVSRKRVISLKMMISQTLRPAPAAPRGGPAPTWVRMDRSPSGCLVSCELARPSRTPAAPCGGG